jgi:hypothetical protein
MHGPGPQAQLLTTALEGQYVCALLWKNSLKAERTRAPDHSGADAILEALMNCKIAANNTGGHYAIVSCADRPEGDLLKRAATWWAGSRSPLECETQHRL